MEILKILQESADQLILEDLDFFEIELATGEGYSDAYKQECKRKIDSIRKWMSEDDGVLDDQESMDDPKDDDVNISPTSNGVFVDMSKIVPGETANAKNELTPLQQVITDIKALRERSDYKSAFKNYIVESSMIDDAFLDKNFSVFDKWEMNAIVSVKQLNEDFLEKYFNAIDKDKIARYQQFSESFFMKHFMELDTNIVLEKGKNEWRKKENRSKQLDVFLRLKGVKI